MMSLARRCALLAALAPMLGAAPCAARPPLHVVVSIPPQAYLARRLGGDRLGVSVLVGPGGNPHNYEPSPSQLVALARADLFFRIGVPFEEALLPKIQSAMAHLEVVDTRQGLTLRSGDESEPGGLGEGHEHGGHEGADPHIWLSPPLLVVQARTMGDALCRRDPSGAQLYRKGLDSLVADLETLHQRLTAELMPVRGQAFMVFHPAWGYFADTYGLTELAVEVEGKAPSARQLARIVDEARRRGVRVVFADPRFDLRTAEIVAENIDGVVVSLDPMAEDCVANLSQAADRIISALAPVEPGSGSSP